MGIGEGDASNPTEVVVPRAVGDKILTPDEAIAHYEKTGEHLGKFGPAETPPLGPLPPPQRVQASEYGRILHEDQENYRHGGGLITPGAAPGSIQSILQQFRR